MTLIRLIRASIGCVILVALAAPVAAQLRETELHGVVRDATGAGVVGAAVTLTDGRQPQRTTTTDATGAYAFRSLEPGRYALVVQLKGFAPASQQIELPARIRTRIDVGLQVAIEQRVEVVSSLDEFRRVTGLSPIGMTLGTDQLGVLPNDPEIMLQVLRELSATSGRADEVKVFVDGQPVGTRLPPKEAIQSIRISTNSFASEFAEPSAGLVEIVTKPASSKYRGESQATFNDSLLNARNFFEPEKRPRRTQSYSGYLSGPIVPSRWSFLAYGGRWMRDERIVVNTRTVNPTTFAIRPFVQSIETPDRIETYSLRTDVTPAKEHLFAAEYAWVTESHPSAGLESGLDLPERAITRDIDEKIARFSLVSVLNPRVSNEIRAQVHSRALRQAAASSAPAVLVLDSFNAGGNQAALGLDRTTREATFSQVLSYNADRHTFRSGINADVIRSHELRRSNLGGTFTFGADVDPTGTVRATPLERYQRTLQGVPGYRPSTFTITRGAPSIEFTDWHFSWFAQDDIRTSNNMTLSFGLRHDMQRQANRFALDLAPRAGLAWMPDGSGRHTIRGAVGLFYERISSDITLDAMRYNGLGAVDLVVDRPAFFPVIPTNLDATIALPTVRLKDETLRSPVTRAATVSYEWQATKTVFGSIGYTGRQGRRLLRSLNLNAPDPLTGVRPHLDRGPMLQFESTARSDTQQVRLTLRRALTRLSVFGTYVLGWTNSDTDGPYTVAADSRTLQGEYGRAASDQRHSVVLGSMFALPHEWSLSNLLTYGSGRPFNITTGFDDNGDLLFLDRPGIGFAGGSGVSATSFGLFDLTRAPGEPMITRNAGQGPSQFMLNVGLAKTVRLAPSPVARASGPYVIFTISAENITNRTNFTTFNGVVTSPLFGIANRALNPRRVELSARLGF